MRLSSLVSGIFAFALALPAMAAPPSGVSGLWAEPGQNGLVTLHWDAPQNTDIAYYRVYYSAVSILDNNGEYDDFEQTDGPETSYAFADALPADGLFAAVLAVNTNGEESEFFAEEIHLMPAAAPAPAEPQVPEVVPAATPPAVNAPTEPLQILSAESSGTNAVRITFSGPVQVRPKSASRVFAITKAGGGALDIHTLQVNGDTVTVVTADQEPGIVYEFRITDAILEEAPGLIIDSASQGAFFTGFKGSSAQPVPVSSVAEEALIREEPAGEAQEASSEPIAEAGIQQAEAPSQQPAEQPTAGTGSELQNVLGLRLQATPMGNGFFNIIGEWDTPSVPKEAIFLVVGQSFDAGKTFVSPHLVPPNATHVEINGIPAGHFGLIVQTMDAYGRVSSGVFESALLSGNLPMPTQAAPAIPAVAPVIAPIANEGGQNAVEVEDASAPPAVLPASLSSVAPVSSQTVLPQSGATFAFLAIAIAGGTVGIARMLHVRRAPGLQ